MLGLFALLMNAVEFFDTDLVDTTELKKDLEEEE